LDRYAVVGNPVAHSKSPLIHAAFARATRQALRYERLLAPLDAFAATVERFAQDGGKGLNVTVPFKLEAFRVAHEVSARARLAGACNTLKRVDGTWHADNTDGAGLVRDLTVNLRVELAARSVLVLGAGGAARGILRPLLGEEPRALTISNRTFAKAEELARTFAAFGPIEAVAPQLLSGMTFDVVISATSAGLSDAAAQPWPPAIFAPGAFAYDLIYGDAATSFQRWALEHGAVRAADGLGMLVEQAAESFMIWRGVRPGTAPVRALLRLER
jgi:shikimate dehydrogenase